MCGRYVSASSTDEIARHFGATIALETSIEPDYNVAPTDPVLVVRQRDDARTVERFRWGLIPFWSKSARTGAKMINARSETAATSSAFKRSLHRHRCIVPADAFYEWTAAANPSGTKPLKQPWCISRVDGAPMAFAGLYARWRDPETDERVMSCTILTCDANETMRAVHDRMPVQLPRDMWAPWLDPDCNDPDQTEGLLRSIEPIGADELTMHAVSTAVNNVRSRGAELVDPVEPLPPLDQTTDRSSGTGTQGVLL